MGSGIIPIVKELEMNTIVCATTLTSTVRRGGRGSWSFVRREMKRIFIRILSSLDVDVVFNSYVPIRAPCYICTCIWASFRTILLRSVGKTLCNRIN